MEIWGVLAAVLSSGIGGTAIVATRALAGQIDPIALGAFRFGIGFCFLLPVALLQKGRWPQPRDWPGTAGLGVLFFGLFPFLFNASLMFTTAARGALALATLPLLTMAVAAALGVERISARKTTGVLIAMSGVAVALLSGLSASPVGAWRGDLLMIVAGLCMALYTVLSRPFAARSGVIPFTVMAMGAGALSLVIMSLASGGFVPAESFGGRQWSAVAYLGVAGGALVFFLWAFAISRTTPTRVAVSVAVNPITASLVGWLVLSEPLRWNIMAGLAAVCVGIVVASPARRRVASPSSDD